MIVLTSEEWFQLSREADGALPIRSEQPLFTHNECSLYRVRVVKEGTE